MRPFLSRALTLLLAGAALAPDHADATYRNYAIAWKSTSFRSQGSCQVTTGLAQEGQANFSVNAVPLPTYTAPNRYVLYGNGDDSNIFTAGFNATLLRWGANHFYFGAAVTGSTQTCVIADDFVTLETGGLSARPLFMVKRRGTHFEGESSVMLDLKEINPGLSANLERLEQTLQDRKAQLLSLGGDLNAAQAELDRLAELKAEIDELSKRPLDSITEADLNDILSRYGDIDPRVRSALQQLLRDLKKDLEALRTELTRIMTEFRGQMGELDDWLAGTPPPSGPDLGDSGTYQPGKDAEDIPDVELPDLNVPDDFDPDNDPYLAYAQQVLQQLETTRQNGAVVNRSGFMSITRSWRQNQDIFEKAIQTRGSAVSQEEVGAFINARTLVLNTVRQHMDEEGWFLDTPVRPSTKALIEYLRGRADTRNQADGLQANLNLWQGASPTAQQDAILETLDGLRGGWQSVENGALAEDPNIITRLFGIGEEAQVIIKEVAFFGLALTPVGDFIDLCEVVTGWEHCIPGGRRLEVGERMFSGLGLIVGSGKFWRGVADAVAPLGKAIANECESLIRAWNDLPDNFTRMHMVQALGPQAIPHVGGLTGKEVKRIMVNVGEEHVSKLAQLLKKKGLRELEEMSMLSLPALKRQYALTHGQAVKALGTMPGKTVAELKTRLQQLNFTELAPAGSGNWVHVDGSVVRIQAATPSRPAYFRREIADPAGNINRDAIVAKVTGAKKFDDDGYPIDEDVFSPPEWTDSAGAMNQVRNWFAATMNVRPDEVLSKYPDAINELEKVWMKQTHFDLLP
ncbi:hypothetical protein SAMN05443572_112254 [Myxococcus fulvus]|uniref:Uncharacterized protein n=1 Tax=Myxococcus fulvus TaxID=33 RepID=A0ABY1CTU9_MYXFU|nr:hypothetical protein [Myxococcus fulvus]SEU37833.1 hypothetical protein SAMN05443572_112254 [Myxococcus fulvus]